MKWPYPRHFMPLLFGLFIALFGGGCASLTPTPLIEPEHVIAPDEAKRLITGYKTAKNKSIFLDSLGLIIRDIKSKNTKSIIVFEGLPLPEGDTIEEAYDRIAYTDMKLVQSNAYFFLTSKESGFKTHGFYMLSWSSERGSLFLGNKLSVLDFMAPPQQYSNRISQEVLDAFLSLKLHSNQIPRLTIKESFGKAITISRQPATITVSPDGRSNHKTIIEALDSAQPGDTILLKPGQYGDAYINTSSIKLTGEDKKAVKTGQIIIGPGTKGVTVEKITVAAGRGYAGIVVKEAEDVKFTDCAIRDSHDGIFIKDSNSVHVRRCEIVGNAGSGIAAINSKKVIIEDTLVARNAESGITLRNVDGRVEHTTIAHQEDGWGLISDSKGMVSIYNNIVAFNGGGIWTSGTSTVEYNDSYQNRVLDYWGKSLSKTNLSINPYFIDNRGDFRLRPKSRLTNKGMGGTYIGAFQPVGITSGAGDIK